MIVRIQFSIIDGDKGVRARDLAVRVVGEPTVAKVADAIRTAAALRPDIVNELVADLTAKAQAEGMVTG